MSARYRKPKLPTFCGLVPELIATRDYPVRFRNDQHQRWYTAAKPGDWAMLWLDDGTFCATVRTMKMSCTGEPRPTPQQALQSMCMELMGFGSCREVLNQAAQRSAAQLAAGAAAVLA